LPYPDPVDHFYRGHHTLLDLSGILMTVLQLGAFALAAVCIGWAPRFRGSLLFSFNIFVLFWLQPSQQFVSLAFWIPCATLALMIVSWITITPAEARGFRANSSSYILMAAIVLLFDLNRELRMEEVFMTTTPPIERVIVMLGLLLVLFWILSQLVRPQGRPGKGPYEEGKAASRVGIAMLLLIIAIFIYLKTPVLVELSLTYINLMRGIEPAHPTIPLAWLGYSYIAFRLIHVLRDHPSGRVPSLTLGEFVNYVIFFPALAAGPIDRVERFIVELRAPVPLDAAAWIQAGRRLVQGLFKKFVIADSIAVLALNDHLAEQVQSPVWLWIFLYLFSLQIYFDFSGYTDVAIGLARVLGVRLPENFSGPYLKPNLAQFWNSWHMTLTQWFRAYIFNPLTRTLRERKYPVSGIILVSQLTTMVLIGLWHGITWGFAIWGVWHGLGLFLHNRWREFIGHRWNLIDGSSNGLRQWSAGLLNAMGVFLTFNFVSLGWLFFSLSTPAMAGRTLLRLFGISP
jgi:D-alanyl-lipoteichoic acid acyltransferase DltB (MBOAT superfamily)